MLRSQLAEVTRDRDAARATLADVEEALDERVEHLRKIKALERECYRWEREYRDAEDRAETFERRRDVALDDLEEQKELFRRLSNVFERTRADRDSWREDCRRLCDELEATEASRYMALGGGYREPPLLTEIRERLEEDDA